MTASDRIDEHKKLVCGLNPKIRGLRDKLEVLGDKLLELCTDKDVDNFISVVLSNSDSLEHKSLEFWIYHSLHIWAFKMNHSCDGRGFQRSSVKALENLLMFITDEKSFMVDNGVNHPYELVSPATDYGSRPKFRGVGELYRIAKKGIPIVLENRLREQEELKSMISGLFIARGRV